MNKHTISINHNGFLIDLGDSRLNIRHDSNIDSISVDCGRDKTYICLNGLTNKYSNARVLEVEGYHSKELANLVFDLIDLKKPNKLYLGTIGMDVGIREYLMPKLTKHKIVLSKSGTLIYDLDEANLIK